MWQNKFNRYEEIDFKKRLYFLFGILGLCFFLVLLRLFYLQIIKYSYFRFISENNRIYREPLKAMRGRILSRDGEVFVDNRQGFSVMLSRSSITKESLENLSKFFDFDIKNVFDIDDIKNKSKNKNFEDILIARDIPVELMWLLKENAISLPGINIVEESIRDYKDNDSGSHFLGYINEINQIEFSRLRNVGYSRGDVIGQTGIEKQYDIHLKGIDGIREIETDVVGNKLRVLTYKEAKPGKDIKTTIYYDLQLKIEELLKDKKGTIIILDALDSAVLGIGSSPGFDANQFLYNIDLEKITSFTDIDSPMLNRAIQSRYPPASIFKIITTIAALEENIIEPEDVFTCKGGLHIGRQQRYFKCWKKEGHQKLDLVGAFKESCDVYYYNIALKLPYEKIYKHAKMLGLNDTTGIDLPFEVAGFIPASDWKKKRMGNSWFLGDTVNASIGQGFLLTTPIGIANMMVSLINYGNVYRPYIVKSVVVNNKEMELNSFKIVKKLDISKPTIDFVLKAMNETVKTGTGRRAFLSDFDVSGKTGTAENPHGEDHAWFLGFAPYEKPEIVVCVFIETGGGGGGIAAPIAVEIFKEYKRIKEEAKNLQK